MRKDEFPIVDKYVQKSMIEVLQEIRQKIEKADSYGFVEGRDTRYINDIFDIIDEYIKEDVK